MERLEASVSGRVQGVMYRDYVATNAQALRLTGFVQNIPDGTVRVIAEGPRKDLETLLTRLKKGPLFSKVDDVRISWQEATGTCTTFEIRR